MIQGLLPIGTVVLLKGNTKRVMIVGILQKQADEERLWDYAGVLYPQGYIGPDKTFLFQNEQIERIHALGFQDEEQFLFKEKIDELHKNITEK